MKDESFCGRRRLIPVPGPTLPVEALVLGKPVEEAAALLPRLFNLCRTAQRIAARAALGLPDPGAGAALSREILRDHLLKFTITWPAFFGCPPTPLPANWAEGGPALRRALFGPAGRMPATLADFRSFLASGEGVAAVLQRIAGVFGPGEAAAATLPPVSHDNAFAAAPVENSVAARHLSLRLMQELEDEGGRGPLWRAAGRALDIEACLDARLPEPAQPGPGRALVPAARGLYAVAARVADGRVTAFRRVTPTDHLLAPGGVLDLSLAALPAGKEALAPLLLDILDPCSPVRLREDAHA